MKDKEENRMIFSIEEAKEFVIKAGLELLSAGLVARTWGNISARISDTQFVITPSGRSYDSLTKDDIVVVNIADGSYEGEIKPSGEKGVHAAVYELRQSVNFVIHTHQNYASALSILGKNIKVPDDDDRIILSDVIPCADYGMYATKRLVNNIKEALLDEERCKAVLMKYHGALCFGRDYEEAFAAAYTMEKVCKNRFKVLCGNLPKGAEEKSNRERFDEEQEIEKVKEIWGEQKIAESLGAEYIEDGSSLELDQEKEIHFPEWKKEKRKKINETASGADGEVYPVSKELVKVIYEKYGTSELLCVSTPYVREVSSWGRTQRPYLDDLAQIAGADIKCISQNANTSELLEALKDRNAVFIKGKGAVCTGIDKSEAEAVGIVLEKACMASYLARCIGDINPLGKISAFKDRQVYVSSYSKLK